MRAVTGQPPAKGPTRLVTFRQRAGHFAQDTAEARELIQATVTEENFVGVSARGNQVYARLLETGKQIWVWVREGTIREGGYNDQPWSVERLLRGSR